MIGLGRLEMNIQWNDWIRQIGIEYSMDGMMGLGRS
jgi:hypothetical protein